MAKACPQCAYPLSSGDIITMEATSKLYKLLQLIGSGLLFVGTGLCLASYFAAGLFIILASFVTYYSGRIGAWWNNG